MNWTFLAILLLLFAATWITTSIVFWSWRNGISPMPSSPAAKKAILLLLPQDLQGPIYELGAGWGTLAFVLADMFPHCRIEAYETSLVPYLACWARQKIAPRANLHLHRRDFFAISLKDAAAVICYLYPKAMENLKEKFIKELPPLCWIVSNTFAIPGWKPSACVELKDLYRTTVYLYKSP